MNAVAAAMFLAILAFFALLAAFFATIGSVTFAVICIGVILMAGAGAIYSFSH